MLKSNKGGVRNFKMVFLFILSYVTVLSFLYVKSGRMLLNYITFHFMIIKVKAILSNIRKMAFYCWPILVNSFYKDSSHEVYRNCTNMLIHSLSQSGQAIYSLCPSTLVQWQYASQQQNSLLITKREYNLAIRENI